MRLAVAMVAGLGWAVQAQAETIVSPEAFEALVEGRTLHFKLDGRPFGSEQFFAGRRSLWRFADNLCEAGTWEPKGKLICFTYEAAPEPLCWAFVQEGTSYAGVLVEGGAAPGFRLDLDRIDTVPLPCPGPRVGS